MVQPCAGKSQASADTGVAQPDFPFDRHVVAAESSADDGEVGIQRLGLPGGDFRGGGVNGAADMRATERDGSAHDDAAAVERAVNHQVLGGEHHIAGAGAEGGVVEAKFTGDPGALDPQDRCHFTVVKADDAVGTHPRAIEPW